jgi:LysR family transcriptional activator of dmlA
MQAVAGAGAALGLNGIMNTPFPLLEDLRLFCLVVRKRSFVASATELGVSPAYVSKRIAILENALNAKLLHRTTRRINVTDHGETVFQWTQRILEDVDEMTEAVSTSRTTPRGVLSICTSTGFGRNHVAPAVSELATRYPSLQVQLHFLDRPVDMLEEGFDLDIRVGVVHEPTLIARRIASNHRILCASPAYLAQHPAPERPADLAQHHCIPIRERDQAFGLWRLTGPNGTETVKVSGPLSVNNGETAHRWAIDGHGIVLRSEWDVRASLQTGALARVLPDYHQEAHVWAVYPSRLSHTAKVRACVELLEERLGRTAMLREESSPHPPPVSVP